MVDLWTPNTGLVKPRPHASYEDWDFSENYWSIVEDQFVSAPSSIRWQKDGAWTYCTQLCKNTATLQVKQGAFVTYWRQSVTASYLRFHFRNIIAPGNANIENCYLFWTHPTIDYWRIYERVAGGDNRQWETSKITQDLDTWYRMRLSWWESWGIMSVKLEQQIDGSWVQQGDILTITDPLYGDETYQRVGYTVYIGLALRPNYYDDTEIWGPS